ncbi:SMI1/KNR4 family protein [Spirillospora sp. NPDC047279]|uniref:SMI1/KNR4 family protein n=1 Tax=Spirillospora sp. NPDC047279 TaxID=3155478 RepID=UPI00340B13E1
MWRALIERHHPEASLNAPASEDALRRAGRSLGHPLPADLARLLGESDGVTDDYGNHLVMPVEELVARNREHRTDESFKRLYMSFDQLLFFSDAPGDGSLFAFAVVPEDRPDVFLWEHETDSRRWAAPSLTAFLERGPDGLDLI